MSDAEMTPDLVVLQFVDNDIRCDGTDAANAGQLGRTLDGPHPDRRRPAGHPRST